MICIERCFIVFLLSFTQWHGIEDQACPPTGPSLTGLVKVPRLDLPTSPETRKPSFGTEVHADRRLGDIIRFQQPRITLYDPKAGDDLQPPQTGIILGSGDRKETFQPLRDDGVVVHRHGGDTAFWIGLETRTQDPGGGSVLAIAPYLIDLNGVAQAPAARFRKALTHPVGRVRLAQDSSHRHREARQSHNLPMC